MQISASGEALPWTRVEAGRSVLRFSGRPGPLLLAAVEAAERIDRDRLAREAMAETAPAPSDVRD